MSMNDMAHAVAYNLAAETMPGCEHKINHKHSKVLTFDARVIALYNMLSKVVQHPKTCTT